MGERIAAHMREATCGRHTTQPDHMPETHRAYADWTIDKMFAAADRIGASTGMMVRVIIEAKYHREQGLRAALGIVRLARQFGKERLEAACLRALACGAKSYGSVRSILDNKLDQHPLETKRADARPIGDHANVRGRTYYN
jgi:transposase